MTLILVLGIHNWRTVISFLVKVPVLSVQITVTALRVSTADNRRTKAFCLAMRLTPIAKARLTVGNKPSGTNATIIPMAKMKLSLSCIPTSNLVNKNITTPILKAMMVMM